MHLLIRADAFTTMGTGHVMRCLALAQAWKDDKGDVLFVMTTESSALETRLRSEGIEIVYLSAQPGSIDDAIQTAHLACQRDATWVVVDGYHFDSAYQTGIKEVGLKLMVIDDYGHAKHYFGDLVLNQNLHADEALYVNREPYSRLLLGTRYVLLRSEFLDWRGWQREIPKVAYKVLVTLGGSDLDNVTLKVIRALNKVNIRGLEVKLIVGASNPHLESLKNAILSAPCSMHILKNVENIADLMAWADIAVSAGGITCWELVFMGMPSVLVAIAKNQVFNTSELQAIRAALTSANANGTAMDDFVRLIGSLILDPELRREMSGKARSLVDGMGAKRVVEAIETLDNGEK